MLPRRDRMDVSTLSTTNLTVARRIDWLGLIRSDNIGPRDAMSQTSTVRGNDRRRH